MRTQALVFLLYVYSFKLHSNTPNIYSVQYYTHTRCSQMMRLTWSIWLIVSIVWTFNTFANAFCMFEEKNVCITPSVISIGTGLAEALMSIVSLIKRWQTDKICFPNFRMRIGFGCISNHFARFLIKERFARVVSETY